MYDYITVIPAISEFDNIRNLLCSLSKNDDESLNKTLILFIVNNSASSSEEIKCENKDTIIFLDGLISKASNSQSDINPRLNLAYIDASTEGKELPLPDAGVGLARKIGMDLALTRFNYSNKNTKLIICLDSDCTVAPNYLHEIINFRQGNFKTGYVRYEHPMPGNEEEKKAIICYEIVLRYYVLGLIFSSSPFAFHTIGSTMICDHESYIRIGGMNKRKAAEDFYFMEKLAKISEIECIGTTTVYPASRGSWRVPFGTGQRVNRFFARTHNEYFLNDPEIFGILKLWLSVFNNENILSAEEYLRHAKSISGELYNFLSINTFENSWNKILQNSKSAVQIQKQKVMWFDGFRTLKLIHHLRDTVLPPKPMFPALSEIFEKMDIPAPSRIFNNDVPSIDAQYGFLSTLRRVT